MIWLVAMSHNTTSWKSHRSTWRWTAGNDGRSPEGGKARRVGGRPALAREKAIGQQDPRAMAMQAIPAQPIAPTRADPDGRGRDAAIPPGRQGPHGRTRGPALRPRAGTGPSTPADHHQQGLMASSTGAGRRHPATVGAPAHENPGRRPGPLTRLTRARRPLPGRDTRGPSA